MISYAMVTGKQTLRKNRSYYIDLASSEFQESSQHLSYFFPHPPKKIYRTLELGEPVYSCLLKQTRLLYRFQLLRSPMMNHLSHLRRLTKITPGSINAPYKCTIQVMIGQLRLYGL